MKAGGTFRLLEFPVDLVLSSSFFANTYENAVRTATIVVDIDDGVSFETARRAPVDEKTVL
jgi:hypothetical protein